jgi:integrase
MKTKKIKTNTSGVRYYEHSTRKHGIRKDRYFTIRYKLNGKDKEEALGWESEGWTEKKAAAKLIELKENQRIGLGETTLADKRRVAKEKATNEEKIRVQTEKDLITFSSVFEQYFKQALLDKNAQTCRIERYVFNKWLAPFLGPLPIKNIFPLTLENLKKQMNDAGRSPGTITRNLALVSQVINYARRNDLYFGDNPTTKVKKPSQDNRRSRFLSHEEAGLLLEELATNGNGALCDMSLLSLHCGLRAGEIFKLNWSDVDFDNEIILIKDTKSGRNRNAIMTADVKKMLKRRKLHTKSGIVFPSRAGGRIVYVSNTFDRTITKLGFNKGVMDRRQKIVFHTLRHTYASWLVMSGASLYTVQRLMGHSTISMTERYSHLAPDHLKRAIDVFQESINRHKGGNLVGSPDLTATSITTLEAQHAN